MSESIPRAVRLTILSLVAFILAAFPFWLPWIGTFLIASDPLGKADALVVLAGDTNERLAYGKRLHQQGYASWFVVTNMRVDDPDMYESYAAMAKQRAVEMGVPEERILVPPGTVATTYEEAVVVRAFAEQHGFRSLIFVTSPYHSHRARWIINQVFDNTGISIIVRPVEDSSFQATTWWRTAAGRQQTTLEYAKMLAHLLGCRHVQCFSTNSEARSG